MQHLEEGTIHAWLDGALSSEESAQVEQHARECAECAAMVADARGLIAGAARIVSALDIVPGGVIPKAATATPAARPLWRKLHLSPFRAALAASLMIGVASLFAVRGSRDDVQLMEMKAAAPAPAAFDATASAPAPASGFRPEAERQEAASARRAPEARSTASLRDSTRSVDRATLTANTEASAITRRVNERARAVVDTTRALQAIVAAAAPPPAAVAQQTAPQQPPVVRAEVDQRRAFADSARAKVGGGAAGGGRGGVAGGRARPAADVAASLTASGYADARADFSGCYTIADTASWPSGLPLRFAMTTDTTGGTPPQNLVRPLNAAGRVDSTAVGTWRPLGPTASVLLNDGPREVVFALTRSMSPTLTRVVPAGLPVRVARADCPR
jgi:hypothetical protein